MPEFGIHPQRNDNKSVRSNTTLHRRLLELRTYEHNVSGCHLSVLPAPHCRCVGVLRRAQPEILRRSFSRNGEFFDQILYVVIQDDWMASREAGRQTCAYVH